MSDAAGWLATKPVELTEDHMISVLLVRRARETILGKDLFSDPAWDILLQLFAARLGGRAIKLHDLAVAIEVPLSTTVRWVAALEEQGLIEQIAGEQPSTIKLTENGADRMQHLASRWASAFVAIA